MMPMRRPTHSLTASLVAILAATAIATPVQGKQVETFFSGVAQGAAIHADDAVTPARRWMLRGGYGVTGEVEATTDAGLKFGVTATVGSGDTGRSLDRPGTDEPLTLSEGFLWVSSAWGKIRLGDEDGAARRAIDLLPLIGGGQVDGYWTDAFASRPDHLGRTSDDATKLLIETQRLFGLRLGVSFAPERKSLIEDLDEEPGLAREGDFWEAGINWQGDSGPWSWELAAGYSHGQGRGAGVADTRSIALSGLLLYGGFGLGAVAFDETVGIAATATTPGGGRDRKGLTWHGVYENGPYGAALWASRVKSEGVGTTLSHGLGLSWRATEWGTLGLDVVRISDNPAGPVGTDKGWVGQMSVTGRF